MNNINDVISQTVISFIEKNPFFANLLLTMKRKITTDVQTCGVNITDTVNLYINPYFFLSLSQKERYAVLEHECLHLISDHISRGMELEPELKEKSGDIFSQMGKKVKYNRLNIAMDAAINEWIPNIPMKMILLDKEGNEVLDENGEPQYGTPVTVTALKEKYTNIEHKMQMEYYYAKLLEEQNKEDGEGEGEDTSYQTIDDHSLWSQGNQNSEHVKEIVKDIVNSAVKKVGIGNIPGNIIEAINSLNKSEKNWKKELQKFVSQQMEFFLESTRKKRNRRFGLVLPGYKKEPKLKLAIAIDSSGSVSDEYIIQFFSEIDKIFNLGIDITVIEADCIIQQVFEYKPKMKINLMGRGGTAYQPALDAASNLSVDGLIYLGDMEIWEQLKKPNYPVLWAGTEGAKIPASFGRFTEIKLNVKK